MAISASRMHFSIEAALRFPLAGDRVEIAHLRSLKSGGSGMNKYCTESKLAGQGELQGGRNGSGATTRLPFLHLQSSKIVHLHARISIKLSETTTSPTFRHLADDAWPSHRSDSSVSAVMVAKCCLPHCWCRCHPYSTCGERFDVSEAVATLRRNKESIIASMFFLSIFRAAKGTP